MKYFIKILNGINLCSGRMNLNNFLLIVIKIIGLIEANKTIDNFIKPQLAEILIVS